MPVIGARDVGLTKCWMLEFEFNLVMSQYTYLIFTVPVLVQRNLGSVVYKRAWTQNVHQGVDPLYIKYIRQPFDFAMG